MLKNILKLIIPSFILGIFFFFTESKNIQYLNNCPAVKITQKCLHWFIFYCEKQYEWQKNNTNVIVSRGNECQNIRFAFNKNLYQLDSLNLVF